MDKNLLEIKALQVHFSNQKSLVKAVDGVNLTLAPGETLGIVGESGSGKSISALSIMNLVPKGGLVKAGTIQYKTKSGNIVNLLDCTADQMAIYRGNEIAMIFQEPMTSLNPVFRCGEQVMEAIMLHQGLEKKTAKKQVLSLFEKVKLPDPTRIYKAFPHQLSGGQKQRVMIAMALCCNPQILIADEPTTALDVTVQKTILELMNSLKSEFNAAVIFITHDLGVIAEVADRVAVMLKGKVVEEGKVKAIFTNPQHPYTKGLLACRPPLKYRLKRLPVIQDFMQIEEKKGSETLEGNQQDLAAIIKKLSVKPAVFEQRLNTLQEQPALLQVRDLKTWFPQKKNIWGKVKSYVKAVDGVNFDVYSGETLGLVGESGCGKTTLGRTILRLVPYSSGDVIYEDQSVFERSTQSLLALRKKMQIIFQDPFGSLNPRIRIGKAIMEPMQVHGIGENDDERRQKVMDLLETVHLKPGHFDRYPHEFSGGQRQRVCIARTLAVEPRFIVCDESVSALDVSVQAQVLNLLVELREQFGLTYIFISHDLSVVKFMSDRILVMNEGKIVEEGPSEAIYANPQNPYTQKLIAAIPKGIRW